MRLVIKQVNNGTNNYHASRTTALHRGYLLFISHRPCATRRICVTLDSADVITRKPLCGLSFDDFESIRTGYLRCLIPLASTMEAIDHTYLKSILTDFTRLRNSRATSDNKQSERYTPSESVQFVVNKACNFFLQFWFKY